MKSLIERMQKMGNGDLVESRIKPMKADDLADGKRADKNYRSMIDNATKLVDEASVQVGQIATQASILSKLAQKNQNDRYLMPWVARGEDLVGEWTAMHNRLEDIKKILQYS